MTNDPSEMTYGINILKEEFKKLSRAKDVQLPVLSQTEHQGYIFCFSKKKDSLNQWRSYTSPKYGVCIGFDIDVIERKINSQIEMPFNIWGNWVQKCIYVSDEQPLGKEGVNRIKEFYEFLIENDLIKIDENGILVCTHGNPVLYQNDNEMFDLALIKHRQLCFNLTKFLSLFKHQCYFEEQEYRLFLNDTGLAYRLIEKVESPDIPVFKSEVNYKTNRYGLTSYLKVQFPFDVVKEVMIGSEVRAENLKILKEMLCVGGDNWQREFAQSKIPFLS
ncbi:DUF2971 domain-containing protein [Parashewanella curva]|nr:DUF2971 domain-containing protein [Parashewanella curva]